MHRVQLIYDEMWDNALSRFQAGKYEPDPLLQNPADTRRGLTLLARIEGPVSEHIRRFLDALETIEPDQYYYPTRDLHLTVLSVISCDKDFQLSDVNPEAYIRTIENCVQDIQPFQVEYRGITASPSCVLIQGFPVGEQLSQLRANLRQAFSGTDLESSIDSRYTITTAHATAVRFLAPVSDSNALISVLSEYRTRSFGTLEVKSLELVFNDWYQRAANTRKLQTFRL